MVTPKLQQLRKTSSIAGKTGSPVKQQVRSSYEKPSKLYVQPYLHAYGPAPRCKNTRQKLRVSPGAGNLLLLQSNDEQEGLIPSNLMFNRRVVRGNTYSAQILPGDIPILSKPVRCYTQSANRPCHKHHRLFSILTRSYWVHIGIVLLAIKFSSARHVQRNCKHLKCLLTSTSSINPWNGDDAVLQCDM